MLCTAVSLVGLSMVTYGVSSPAAGAATLQGVDRGAASRVSMTFKPEGPQFVEATEQYRAIWAAHGDRMVDALETVSGLKFPDDDVQVVVFEGVSRAGMRGGPMMMRASYSEPVKRGSLMHELGHRLIGKNQQAGRLRTPPAEEMDDHRILYLFLYDAYVKLYGKEFADNHVAFDRKLKGLYDYDAAWNWALALTADERAAKFRSLLVTPR